MSAWFAEYFPVFLLFSIPFGFLGLAVAGLCSIIRTGRKTRAIWDEAEQTLYRLRKIVEALEVEMQVRG